MIRNVKVTVDYDCAPFEEINEAYSPLRPKIYKKSKFTLKTKNETLPPIKATMKVALV
jgi:hypothetical protein